MELIFLSSAPPDAYLAPPALVGCFSDISYIILTYFKYAAPTWFVAIFLAYCYLVLLLPLIKFIYVVQTKFNKISDHVEKKKVMNKYQQMSVRGLY